MDQRVEVGTECGLVAGILRAVSETFLEVEEDGPATELTVFQCARVCFVSLVA